jgi:hypothetical protein
MTANAPITQQKNSASETPARPCNLPPMTDVVSSLPREPKKVMISLRSAAIRGYPMKWQLKSTVLRALGTLPSGGDNLYYFLQRNVTRSLPRPIQRIPTYAAIHRRHIEAFRSRGMN